MKTLLINPSNNKQFELLSELLKQLKIKTTVLSKEDKEEMGLLALLSQADRGKKVSEASILKKLKS